MDQTTIYIEYSVVTYSAQNSADISKIEIWLGSILIVHQRPIINNDVR